MIFFSNLYAFHNGTKKPELSKEILVLVYVIYNYNFCKYKFINYIAYCA